jgi:PleD family two-component response regulator
VEKSRFDWQGSELGVTVSVGVTIAAEVSGYVPGRTERALVEAADRALYLAKQQGRNRVVAMSMASAPENPAS